MQILITSQAGIYICSKNTQESIYSFPKLKFKYSNSKKFKGHARSI